MPLRHSTSQIFGSLHPALATRESDGGPSFWRGRSAPFPRALSSQSSNEDQNTTGVQAQENHNIELHQAAASSTAESLPPLSSPLTPSAFPNGIMPMHPATSPFTAPALQALQPTLPVFKGLQAAWGAHATHRDVASLHPVFFSERLQRSPFAVDPTAATATLTSPVALGYAYPETSRSGARL